MPYTYVESITLQVRSDRGDYAVSCALAPSLLTQIWKNNPELSPAAIIEAALTKLALEVKAG